MRLWGKIARKTITHATIKISDERPHFKNFKDRKILF